MVFAEELGVLHSMESWYCVMVLVTPSEDEVDVASTAGDALQ